MYNIKSLYTDYGEIIATFGEDKIESRITYFLDAINSFISAFNSEDITALEVNDKDLQKTYDAVRKESYRLKTIQKIDIFKKSNVDYLFIYQQDMYNGSFKQKTIEFLRGDG